MNNILLTCLLACLLSLLVAVSGRPNPVPNDDIPSQEFLRKYEKAHDQPSVRVKRHKRVRGPEDPDDLDVLNELKPVFQGIPRRNRDLYSKREDIFQHWKDQGYYSDSDAS